MIATNRAVNSLDRALQTLHAQHLEKPYTTFRSLRDVANAFDDQQLCDASNPFIRALLALGPGDAMLDIGAGQGIMARQYLAEADLPFDAALKCPPLAERGRAILVDIKKPQETTDWESSAGTEVLHKYAYLETYFETAAASQWGTVKLAVDYYGGASYTLRLAEYFDRLLQIVQPHGEVFVVFNGVSDDSDRRTIADRVRQRVDALHDKIHNARLGGLGREKVRRRDAADLHDSFVLRRDGELVSVEDWVCGLSAFDSRRFASATPFSHPHHAETKADNAPDSEA